MIQSFPFYKKSERNQLDIDYRGRGILAIVTQFRCDPHTQNVPFQKIPTKKSYYSTATLSLSTVHHKLNPKSFAKDYFLLFWKALIILCTVHDKDEKIHMWLLSVT